MNLPAHSMMQPRSAGNPSLVKAQRRLMASLAAPAPGPGTAPAHGLARPLVRGLQWGALASHRATAQAQAALRAAPVWTALAADAKTAGEAWQMLLATVEQWQGWQAKGTDALAAWLEEWSQLRHADTVSKAADQEMNLTRQWMALVQAQTTAALQLADNVQTSWAWWLTRRAEALEPPVS